MDTRLIAEYRKVRAERSRWAVRASQAILWARHTLKVDALSKVVDWESVFRGHHLLVPPAGRHRRQRLRRR
jgi:hypothetical protein